jgi:hypothetical protein
MHFQGDLGNEGIFNQMEGKMNEYQATEGDLLRNLTRDSFDLAHDYVQFRNKLNVRAKILLGIFRKIDYQSLHEEASDLETQFVSLQEKVRSTTSSVDNHMLSIPLQNYLEAACLAAHLTKVKIDIMQQQSVTPSSRSKREFMSVNDQEWEALKMCQQTGDNLTKLYRYI